MRTWATFLVLLLLLTGCTASTPGEAPQSPPPASAQAPAAGDSHPVQAGTVPTRVPRLLLDLPVGDSPDRPGVLPSRVGGVAERGPLALAVENGLIYLADAAVNRIRVYDLQGGQAGAISAPWLDDQVVDLATAPAGLVVASPGVRYLVDRDGRLLEVGDAPQATGWTIHEGKGPFPIGEDRFGNQYLRQAPDEGGLVIRRVSPDGRAVSADAAGLGEVRDWYISRDGALYALAYQWGTEGLERARVFEVLPSVTVSSGPGGVDPYPAPEVAGYTLPQSLRLTADDWPVLDVTAEVDRWNLWQLLAGATPVEDPDAPAADWGPRNRSVAIEARLPDGSALALSVRNDELTLDGRRYRIPFPDAVWATVEHLRLSAESLDAALGDAATVRIVLPDLPGMERELAAAERDRIRRSLAGAVPASNAAGPQPLDPPFPRYALELEGEGWSATLVLRGERHLQRKDGGSALHSGELTGLVAELLPVPAMAPDDVGYLYLADRLDIGDGHDLTRWKNTVVRYLIGAQTAVTGYQGDDAFTLTFWVNGEPLAVDVDETGFTYRGAHYPRMGLTALSALQGVP